MANSDIVLHKMVKNRIHRGKTNHEVGSACKSWQTMAETGGYRVACYQFFTPAEWVHNLEKMANKPKSPAKSI